MSKALDLLCSNYFEVRSQRIERERDSFRAMLAAITAEQGGKIAVSRRSLDGAGLVDLMFYDDTDNRRVVVEVLRPAEASKPAAPKPVMEDWML